MVGSRVHNVGAAKPDPADPRGRDAGEQRGPPRHARLPSNPGARRRLRQFGDRVGRALPVRPRARGSRRTRRGHLLRSLIARRPDWTDSDAIQPVFGVSDERMTTSGLGGSSAELRRGRNAAGEPETDRANYVCVPFIG